MPASEHDCNKVRSGRLLLSQLEPKLFKGIGFRTKLLKGVYIGECYRGYEGGILGVAPVAHTFASLADHDMLEKATSHFSSHGCNVNSHEHP